MERVPSGVPGLDTVLNGGFLRGGIYIVQGPPGTGKTTIGNQICFNHVSGGGKAIYFTLLAEYHARMMLHLSTMSFFDRTRMPDQLAYLNGLRTLLDTGLKGLLALLRREISERGASVLVLDGMIAARRIAADEQAFNEFVHELQAVAVAADCTMFLLTSSAGTQTTPEYTVVDGIIELSDRAVGWSAQSILRVVKFRGGRILRGQHAFKITGDGVVVHPRIEALLARPTIPDPGSNGRIPIGVDQLDTLLGGGIPESSTTIIMGPSGAGKTTLGLHFLSRCSEAAPGLMFSFYETPVRLAAKIDRISPALSGMIDAGVVELQWQPPTDDLLDAYGDRIVETVRRRQVKRLFIDGLGAMQEAAGSEPERMGNFLTALMNEMRVRGVTTLYTAEVTDVMGPAVHPPVADLSSLGENLILMRYVEHRARLHRLVSILKVRDSEFDPDLYEYTIRGDGLNIAVTSDVARDIMAGTLCQHGAPFADGQPRERHGR